MLNKCMLIGRLGKDPEARYMPDGKMIANFSVATDESYKNKDGERVQKTEWHSIVTFGKLAEISSKYLVKGKLVYVEGKMQTRSWDDKEGKKRYSTEIVANNVRMLEVKGGARESPPDEAAPPAEAPDDDVPF